MGDLDDISDNEGSEYNEKIEGEDEDDDEYDDELDGKGRRRRGKRRKVKRQPLDDMRLEAEPIYLQRLWAPH